MAQDFFEHTGTVECPKCGTENEFDLENDGIVCDGCDAILNIDETPEEGFIASVV